MATQELKRMAALVARLRDLNRPSGSQNKEPTDLDVLLKEVLALTHKQCQQHQVEVTWRESEGLPTLRLVPDRMRQVFLNLVLNAIEAMDTGGEPRVGTIRTDEPPGVEVTFADTGPGIPPENLADLFAPSYTTKPSGTGLGLYISHYIVEEHQGHIEVESSPGAGAIFRVWLPGSRPSD
jgi:signal transduction histidine kinase